MRLDTYICTAGLAKSRTKAASLISGGFVTVNGAAVTKPSADVTEADSVEVIGDDVPFVSRGGLKLEGAIKAFGIDVGGMICADIGASTGGFTHCLLMHGAKHVCAIDSGHDQLDESLKNDPRVTNIEGFNARNLTESVTGGKCGIAVCDLSFISQTLVIPAVSGILGDGGLFVSLIKPQFECGRGALGKNGIVRDKKMHLFAIRKVFSCAVENGLIPQNVIPSPIKGGDGNREFLFLAEKNGDKSKMPGEAEIKGAVFGE